MYPAPFRYERPETLDTVVELLGEHGGEARPLAGGQSLLPLMKLRVAEPEVLIDLVSLSGVDYLEVGGDWIRLGLMCTHAQVESSEQLRATVPMVSEAMAALADVQVRQLGTVAGSLAEADPGGDWGPLLLALGGEVSCRSLAGERVVTHEDLFVDYLTSAVEDDELIVEIRLRRPEKRSGGAYLKLERRAGDFAVVSAAAQVALTEDGRCSSVGIGLGGVGLVPVKATAAEAALEGTHLDSAAIEEASELVRDQISPISDGRGPDWYKADMAVVHTQRALQLALDRARTASDAGREATTG